MKELWNKINKVILGGVTAIIFLALNYLGWCFGPEKLVPMWVVWLILIGSYAVCVVVYALSSRSIEVTYVLPKVKAIRHDATKTIFLLEKNELFMQGAYVTIAYQDEDDEIEIVLGLGYIETINSQGNMQIVFERTVHNEQVQNIISKLSNDKHCRNAITIKPSISKKLILEEESNIWAQSY